VTLSLAWTTADGVDCLVLRGLPPAALSRVDASPPETMARLLPVMPSEIVDAARPTAAIQPMVGRYQRTDGDVCFAPRFPFRPGTSYTMVVGAALTTRQRMVLRIIRPAVATTPTTEVIAVYPSVAVLPRNALRFYLNFSAPMSEGLAGRHVHLEREDDGQRITGAFSPMDFELWDPSRRRLTVLLDPARIKQGLSPHREAGYPLQEGAAVVLVVERAFRDAADRPLVADHRQRYDIGPDIRRRVDPTRWRVEPPKPETRGPLTIRFERPLDRALLEDCLAVADSRGSGRVAGTVDVPVGEGAWRFVPDDPWTAGPKEVLIDPVLEDIAGNSVLRVFDRDLNSREHDPETGSSVSLPFMVGAP
jgi:hypothetical protein